MGVSPSQVPSSRGARTATSSWERRSPGVITVLGDHPQPLPWAQQASSCFGATQEGGDDAASSQAGDAAGGPVRELLSG